jgi:acetolactate synthase-1/3 small subunit
MKEFTITVFSENKTGLISRIVSVFTRRHINIESLTTSKASIKGIHRFTIVVVLKEEQVRKLVAQIDKQVDVIKAFYYDETEIIHQEVALYKVPTSGFTNGNSLEKLIRKHNARILLHELEKIGIYEFVRSGRIAIVKPMEMLNTYLKSIESTHFN